jgi:hypothetical protein
MRRRITWIIGGAVVALIVAAGVDALRPTGGPERATAGETTTPFSPTTTVVTDVGALSGLSQAGKDEGAGKPLPACSREQLTVSIPPASDIEGRGFSGLVLVRPIVDGCRQDYPYFRVAFRDIRGKQLRVWSGRLFAIPHSPDGRTLSAHFQPIPCRRWDVLPAFVTLGYERTPKGKVFRPDVRCE